VPHLHTVCRRALLLLRLRRHNCGARAIAVGVRAPILPEHTRLQTPVARTAELVVRRHLHTKGEAHRLAGLQHRDGSSEAVDHGRERSADNVGPVPRADLGAVGRLLHPDREEPQRALPQVRDLPEDEGCPIGHHELLERDLRLHLQRGSRLGIGAHGRRDDSEGDDGEQDEGEAEQLAHDVPPFEANGSESISQASFTNRFEKKRSLKLTRAKM